MKEFPDLHQTFYDEAMLQSLIDDISQFGSDIEVIEKKSAKQLVENESVTLQDMHKSLVEKGLRAAQVRYDFDNQRWCDTIISRDSGFQITRISLTNAATAIQ